MKTLNAELLNWHVSTVIEYRKYQNEKRNNFMKDCLLTKQIFSINLLIWIKRYTVFISLSWWSWQTYSLLEKKPALCHARYVYGLFGGLTISKEIENVSKAKVW